MTSDDGSRELVKMWKTLGMTSDDGLTELMKMGEFSLLEQTFALLTAH